jgi:hypothetical protein
MIVGLEEHIEEMGNLFIESGDPLDPDAIAEAVLDIAFSQGLVTEDELELGHHQIAEQARYMFNLP